MLASAIIIFREVLEAALIISIVLAATRGVIRRKRWVSGGVLMGIALASIVAYFASNIADMAEGLGQEIFNAAVLTAAVLMLAWHNIWMATHAQELTARMKLVGTSVAEGQTPMHMLAVVVALAVLREGSEFVLFLYGMAASAVGTMNMVIGGTLGLTGGIIVGTGLYLGLLRIPAKLMFQVTGWLILLLAAGLMSEAARFLVQADLLPTLSIGPLWDTSSFISDHSLSGHTLHILIGYTPRPLGIQLLVYILTLLIIGGLMFFRSNIKPRKITKPVSSLIVIFALGLTTILSPVDASAGDLVYSPIVEGGELELEFIGHRENGGDQQHKWEVGYGFTDRFKSAVFLETEKSSGEGFSASAIAWENIFQLTEQGKYWLDLGLYVEYEHSLIDGGHDKIETKLLMEKQVGNVMNRVNLIFEKDISGPDQEGVEFEYAWQSTYRFSKKLEFGIEGFGGFGELNDFAPSHEQEHSFGPLVMGKLPVSKGWNFKYQVGYQAGLNQSTNDRVKAMIEFETHF